MDKTTKVMVSDIKKSSECNKLVVFIGAGVSANSGYKLWDALIGDFNKELGYSSKTSGFSTDEMLKIPQYFYNTNQERYIEIITQEYGRAISKTNAIVDSVLELNPVHIVTTNFDLLIEKSIEDNHVFGNTVHGSLGKYSIIRGDDDFIHATKSNYLIKMHGDIDSIGNIVLKEEDYLQYSSTHALIETFIKSLFVNNTFLFVGYGLGDYNIKLIMSWVDSILNYNSAATEVNRYSYYFINADRNPLNDFEKNYYKKKNIFIIESTEISEDFLMYPTQRNEDRWPPFEDYRGNNLLKVCDFIKFGQDNDISEIIKDLSVFDEVDCITINELFSKLDIYSDYLFMCDDVLNYRTNLFSIRLKAVIDKIKNNDGSDETKYLILAFNKAGIKALKSDDENEPIFMLNNFGIVTNEIYDVVINCDINRLHEISSRDCDTQSELLQSGYASAFLGYDDMAKNQISTALLQHEKKNDFFHLLIDYQNLSKVNIHEKHVWYILKEKLSSGDKEAFLTLYDYFCNSNDLFKETIETLKELEQRFDTNYYSISSDENNISFTKLRYSIHQTQRYFIENSVYISGYGGYTHVIGNWLKSLDYYIEILITLHSPNAKTSRTERKYVRNSLKKEDIYILITHPENRQLTFLVNKYNLNHLVLEPGTEKYVIGVLKNYLSAFQFEPIVRFKFANNIKNILSLIPLLDFSDNQYNEILQYFTTLLTSILLIPYEKRDYYFNVFYDVVPAVIECIFLLLKHHKKQLSVVSLCTLIESVLSCIDTKVDEETLKYYLANLDDHSVLLNLSNGLDFYFEEKISEGIADTFFNFIREQAPAYLNQFIIELFPILPDLQKEQWRLTVCTNITNIEPVFIRFALINGVFEYDENVCSLLINHCRQQVKDGSNSTKIIHGRTPLLCVLRLVEKNLVTDINAYREFIGHDDLFDFVCFPKEFDYEKFDTNWGSWLTLDRNRTPAFAQAYDILKRKYNDTMHNGPSEIEKAIYYRYFYFEDSPFELES